MPLYEYRCRSCHRRFEVLQRIGGGAAELECPNCGSRKVEKEFSTFASASTSGGCGPAGGRFT